MLLSDKIKQDDLGRACSTHEIDEKFVQNFKLESLETKYY